ncbi:hypothetical protein [Salicola sp. Rm-C-2C1-2]|uniref:hypothetical protein n=1 Tax=Salicola sp. Rm-C-2C1-2 TaxID=3141321 RepID=UPI0032E50FCD
MHTRNTRQLCCWLVSVTLLPLVVSTTLAQQMANPEADAASARSQQEQKKANHTSHPLSLKIQQAEGIRTPRRGERMDSVQNRFGKPQSRRGPVGDPPITRWQYPQFVVVFEGKWVIDTVVESDSDN